jgi:hypothetical protein
MRGYQHPEFSARNDAYGDAQRAVRKREDNILSKLRNFLLSRR